MATSTLPTDRRSSVVTEVRANLFCTKGAGINTRMVRLLPTPRVFFQLCSGLDLLDQNAVSKAFASEMFDLSNNPSRQESREKLWPHRSLSVGDTVDIEFGTGASMVVICLGCGWHVADRLGSIKFKDGRVVDTVVVLEQLEAAGGFFEREDVIQGIEAT